MSIFVHWCPFLSWLRDLCRPTTWHWCWHTFKVPIFYCVITSLIPPPYLLDCFWCQVASLCMVPLRIWMVRLQIIMSCRPVSIRRMGMVLCYPASLVHLMYHSISAIGLVCIVIAWWILSLCIWWWSLLRQQCLQITTWLWQWLCDLEITKTVFHFTM